MISVADSYKERVCASSRDVHAWCFFLRNKWFALVLKGVYQEEEEVVIPSAGAAHHWKRDMLGASQQGQSGRV